VLLELISVAQIEAFAANAIDLGFQRPLPSRQKLDLHSAGRGHNLA
jgi:hypothetical protein